MCLLAPSTSKPRPLSSLVLPEEARGSRRRQFVCWITNDNLPPWGVALANDQQSQRLFFALWPTPELQQQFFAAGNLLHRDCGGRRTACDNIHLTLAFLGEVPQSRLQVVQDCAQQIATDCFILDFDQLGWWRHNKVAWAGCSETEPGLLNLVQSLQAGLEPLGFPREMRAYVPHVTLLRKAGCRKPVTAQADIVWPVSEFVLVKSELARKGARYEILQRYPLRKVI